MARGEATLDSDLDLLVSLSDDKILFDRMRPEIELREALGQKVDVGLLCGANDVLVCANQPKGSMVGG